MGVKVGHHNHHFEINFVSAFFPFFCAPHQHTQHPSQCIASKDVELRMRCDPFYRANTHALLSIAFEPRPHHRFRRERRAVLKRAEKAGLVIVLVAFVPIVPSSRNVQKPGEGYSKKTYVRWRLRFLLSGSFLRCIMALWLPSSGEPEKYFLIKTFPGIPIPSQTRLSVRSSPSMPIEEVTAIPAS